MAGHSQFKNIMHRKGRQDAKRARTFTRLVREVQVAARAGLPDPAANPRLRSALQAARAANVPKDNIERAIRRGSGGEGENYEEVRYEGYGPGGVALIVETLTDNRNRTAADVRAAFTKLGGALGETGSVELPVRPHRRDPLSGRGRRRRRDARGGDRGRRRGLPLVGRTATRSSARRTTSATVRDALEERLGPPEVARLGWRPQVTVPVGPDHAQTLFKLLETLDELDDVQSVTANFEVDDEVLERLSA